MATKRPKKRPADVIGNAVHIMRVATGQIEDAPGAGPKTKDPAAAALGRKGGQARASALSKRRRKEIAETAAKARWASKPRRST